VLVFDDKYLLINGRPSQTVSTFGEFNIIIGVFFSTFNLVSVFLFNFVM